MLIIIQNLVFLGSSVVGDMTVGLCCSGLLWDTILLKSCCLMPVTFQVSRYRGARAKESKWSAEKSKQIALKIILTNELAGARHRPKLLPCIILYHWTLSTLYVDAIFPIEQMERLR